MSYHSLLLACIALSLLGCPSGQSPPALETPAPETAAGTSSRVAPPVTAPQAAEPPVVKPPALVLADSPRMDLVANRHRWHLHGEGLIIPLAAEGFRKYTQEYRRPFGPLLTHQGRRGRVLTRSAAQLRIPWEHEGAATARIWVHGVAEGQRVQLDINGKRAGVVKVSHQEWTQVLIPIKAGMLTPGEQELTLHARTSGRVAGQKTHALFHALELVPGEVQEAATPPVLSPLAGEDALGNHARMVLYTEVPEQGWLRFVASNPGDKPATLQVYARTFDGERVALTETRLEAGASSPQSVELAAFERRVIALELVSSPQVRWQEPHIGLVAVAHRERPKPMQHAILLVVDALRADRLALYNGQTRVRTPHMTQAAQQGFVFLHNQASAPSSPPSHGSIQSGMIPRVHGVAGDKGKLKPGTRLLSAQLADAGFATGYFGNNPFGMRRLKDAGKWQEYHSLNSEGKGIDCEAVVSESLKFAGAQLEQEERFFISALPFEPHTPYRYHEGLSDTHHKGGWGAPVGKSVDGYLLGDITSGRKRLSESQWSQLKALYDGEVEHMDRCFGQLVAGLKALGVDRDTAIVITADHGEGMFEHGRMGHAFGHYAELSNVPFVVSAPAWFEGASGTRALRTVSANIDIAPTLMGLLGVAPSEQVQGEDLSEVALRQGPWLPRVVSMEYGRSWALRSERWKLAVTYAGEESLYDQQEDPLEQVDVVESNPLALRYMRDMAGFFLEHREAWKYATWGSLGNHEQGFVEHVEALEAP